MLSTSGDSKSTTKDNSRTSKKRTAIPSTTETVKPSTETKDNTGIKGTTSRIPHRSPNSPSDNQEERPRLSYTDLAAQKRGCDTCTQVRGPNRQIQHPKGGTSSTSVLVDRFDN